MQPESDAASSDLDRLLAEALAHHQQGRLAEAQSLYTRVLSLAPRHPDALNLLGVVAAQRGQLVHARDLIESALAERPGNPEYLFNRAHILELAGDGATAQAYANVLEAAPDHLPALVNLGNIRLAEDDFDAATELFRRAVEAGPQVSQAHEGLGFALQRLGQADDAMAAFERALALDPNSVESAANLSGLLLDAGEPEMAVEKIERALALRPDSADLHANLGIALMSLGRLEPAVAALSRARELDPRCVRAISTLGFALADRGEPQDLERAALLCDYDRHLQSRRIASVPGYRSVTDFNALLAERMIGHDTLVQDRPSKTTRRGGQTGDLVKDRDPAVMALIETIEAVVSGYLDKLSAGSEDAYFVPPPERWRLSVWGTVLGSGGHQASHNHPTGLVSGVYYAKLPKVVTQDGGSQGWIEFGRSPALFNAKAEPDLKMVEPQEGLMLLFPSYFWHRTIPFESDEPRVSIAFDVIPEA